MCCVLVYAFVFTFCNDLLKKNNRFLLQNGGQFNFTIEGDIGLPTDANFWSYLLSSAKKKWGMITYEQDWLDYTGTHLPATYVSHTASV